MGVAGVVAWGTAAVNVGMLAYAVATWLRHRDPLRGLLVLLYVTGVVIVAVEAYVRLTGSPAWHGVGAAAAVYLFHPVVTLLLAGSLHRVRRRLTVGVLAGAALLAVPVALIPKPVFPPLGLLYMLFFGAVQAAAARMFAREARRRHGGSAVRLRSAALAAWALVLVLLVALAGNLTDMTRSPSNDLVAIRPGGTLFVLADHLLLAASALGYLLAFAPPRWLREAWAARALRTVNRRLLDAPPTETPAEVWRRYADVVRDVTSADAVEVVLLDPSGGLTRPAAAPPDDPPAGPGRAALAALLAVGQPIDLGRAAGRAGPLAVHYAAARGSGLLTAVPISAPRLRGGALIVLHRRQSLFAAADLSWLAELAGQAAVLAERGAVVLRTQRLADELAASVRELTKASRAKSDFLAAVSHELRTPLHAIIGFSDLLRDDRMGNAVHAEWVEHIQRGGFHLLALINDLLDLAKVESGRVDLDRAPVRLDTAVGDLLAALRPMIDRGGLALRRTLPPVTASVDPLRFRQIVENLVANAIAFTDPGGTLTVTLGVAGRTVSVAVADTGVGIAAEDQHLVFEPFRQVRTADKRGGTGLGLALCRRLARAHGGDLTLQSAIGLGTTVTLTLPDALAEPATGPTPPADP
ncbi:sensor histidine kinase [Pilimelia anulata]|uniref:sensor histidine kinase n=1 Tax=Pilimelia anulata TaxID=53371 RepID=UPI00166E4FC4|nr:HAMP domain-containing sensor histidine kinase [Pilimelia anulata]